MQRVELAVFLALAATPCASDGAAPPTLDVSKYRLVFADDFRALSISAHGPGTTWTAHTPWDGDFGDARFADPAPAGPFRASRQGLDIEARKDQDGAWRSGLIASVDSRGVGFAQRYGYFEMRAKLPEGKGLWSAFWLNAVLPQGSTEPGVEIDVIEHYGHFPSAYQALVHIWPKPADEDEAAHRTVLNVAPGSLYADFHTYGVAVDPDFITIYRDRIAQWRCRTPPQHTHDLMLLANLAMGSGWPIDETPNPSVMQIDYIRAYAP